MGVLSALARLFRPPVFTVVIEDRKARPGKGRVPVPFLNDASDIASDAGIPRGRIYGVRKRFGIQLEFSSDIPEAFHQRFRNAFGIHRSTL